MHTSVILCIGTTIMLLVFVYLARSRIIDDVHFFVPMKYRQMAILHFYRDVIRQEALDCLHLAPISKHIRKHDQWVQSDEFMHSLNTVNGWVQTQKPHEDTPDPHWLNYGLMFKGVMFAANSDRCPVMKQLLYMIWPYINVCGFSLLRAGGVIDWHTDKTGLQDGSLAYHLGLVVPENSCTLYVGDRYMQEKEGRVIIFDSNIKHSAVNRSQFDRVVLYVDFSIKPRHF